MMTDRLTKLAKKNWSGGDVITECQGGWTTDQDVVISPL